MKLSRKQQRFAVSLMAAIGLLAVIGAIVYNTLIPHDAPQAVSLSRAVESAAGTRTTATSGTGSRAETGTAASGAGGGATSGSTSGMSGSAGAAGALPAGGQSDDLTGVWTVASGGNSFVGYRVKEELARIGAFTAVGRTSAITGTLQFDGNAITDVRVEADLSTLKSDSTLRDNALRMQALETAKFPKATFVLTQPIALGSVPAEGTPVKATAVGDLTIHGVTRTVSLDLEGQLSNGLVVVVGSTTIKFADYNIDKPRAASVLSIEDQGVLELQLVFGKSAGQS